MINISEEKARKARNKAFLTNIRYMQEKVVAIKAEDKHKEGLIVNTPANQDSKTRDERS